MYVLLEVFFLPVDQVPPAEPGRFGHSMAFHEVLSPRVFLVRVKPEIPGRLYEPDRCAFVTAEIIGMDPGHY